LKSKQGLYLQNKLEIKKRSNKKSSNTMRKLRRMKRESKLRNNWSGSPSLPICQGIQGLMILSQFLAGSSIENLEPT
jgi:hypothetical protein